MALEEHLYPLQLELQPSRCRRWLIVAAHALALLAVGAVRELLGHGTLMMGMEMLFPGTEDWGMTIADAGILLATLPPGAFIVAGLLLGLGNACFRAGGSRLEKQQASES